MPIDFRRISNSIIFNSFRFEHFTDESGNNCIHFSSDYPVVFKFIIDFGFIRTLEFVRLLTFHFSPLHAGCPGAMPWRMWKKSFTPHRGGVSCCLSIPAFNRLPVIPPNSRRTTSGLNRAFIRVPLHRTKQAERPLIRSFS
ncbi:hypothetical protein [Burkholderia sp. Bp9140]|uniref:hypothetical protein n=1 Tax=Burkholderia sp. Bp9140 TaxID=2184572 RepID=UPI000F586C27|nr:hypothetical protein [Burkholderia sp. Bp9140]